MKSLSLFVSLLLICSLALVAQESKEKKMDSPASVRSSYAKQAWHVEQEMESLEQAIPQDKFNWRPMEGVRSIAESFMHAALGNYITLSKITGKWPEGVDMKTYEKSSTEKAKILEELKKSFAAVKEGVENTPEADYSKHVDFFGNDMNVLDMIFAAADHQHELLGQQIAYARMNGIVPPWTAEQMKKQEGMKK